MSTDDLWHAFDQAPVDRDEALCALGWSLLQDAWQEANAGVTYQAVLLHATREATHGDVFL